MNDVKTLLQRRFNPDTCQDLDATMALDWQTGRVVFGIHSAELFLHDNLNAPAAEMVMYFATKELVLAVLGGQKSPIKAFMAGEFRSSGYIVWVFQTLTAFSKAAG